MKLKNTLGIVIGSLMATTSLSILAQGQGAVELEAFGKRYFTDSSRAIENGNLYGGSVGYYLTDGVALALSYGEYHDMNSDDSFGTFGHKDIKGNLSSLDAIYHFGKSGVGLRPYISTGFAHQSVSNVPSRAGRDHSTFANIGSGLKYYFTENLFAKASLDGMYNLDAQEAEWMAGVGIGMNFGGATRAPAPEPVAEPVVEVAPTPEPVETVRVELDVKFDFDKSKVKEESYSDIQNLADFMNQYPQTTTTVEGHTDSVGTDSYNQKLSERRATAVRDVLVNQYGVGANRVDSTGYGESRPVADNTTEAGRAINRRVEAAVEAQTK